MSADGVVIADSRQSSRDLVVSLSAHFDFSSWVLVSAPAGRQIIGTGDVMDRLPLLVSGMLDAVIHHSSDDGNPVVPVIWGPGELVMLSYLFRRDQATVDVVVSEDASFRWIPSESLERVFIRHHELLIQLVRFLSQRLREVQAREQTWLERGVHERVCASLARIILSVPTLADGRVVVEATHEGLAARCGVSRPRLSKELKRLEDAGRLKLGRGTIEIIDRAWFARAGW